ncbi:porin family protein [Flavobacterium nitrogenifigens]|uniref:Outer membrane protein beta-barrel domain-containing protein n=1 Tax=Flavobacterium nitrogenifigens TaxID=1617283 RepID=A0A521DSX4_9FLAO|nr:porin family protein [Flavobacterium nitrogenifigens]KAF2327513.1 PorT family protein [Flavobacterium nitrogenifigens]SMO74682.1 Outer membrane protein beta-barrel domain-containing protein [Flavobacterium nitrogenifigens]
MKKITLFLFTITLITFKTTAQESKFKFGVQAGLTYSSFRGYESFIDEDPGFSYLFGISAQYKLNESLSLRADLDYDRKTQTSKGEGAYISNVSYDRYSIKTTNYLNYITLPIMLKFSFTRNKSFYINGGPYLGYLLKSGWKYKTSGIQNSDENLEDTKYRKSMDFGVSAGFGKEFKLNDNHNIYIELRENLGLTDIAKPAMPTDQSMKTNSLNLIAGFTF